MYLNGQGRVNHVPPSVGEGHGLGEVLCKIDSGNGTPCDGLHSSGTSVPGHEDLAVVAQDSSNATAPTPLNGNGTG